MITKYHFLIPFWRKISVSEKIIKRLKSNLTVCLRHVLACSCFVSNPDCKKGNTVIFPSGEK